jgi:O-antigen/teichoic acid export membrane protein
MLQLLPLLGLSMPLTRRMATDAASRQQELSNAFAFALPVTVLMALGLGVVGRLSYPDWLHLPFWLLAGAILLSSWIHVAEVSLLGMERAADVAKVEFTEAALRCALALLAVWWGWGLVGVFSAFLLGRVLTAVRLFAMPGLPRPVWALVTKALLRRNLHELPVYFGIAVLAAIGSRLDLIVLSRLGGLLEVGHYAAAARLYEASLMLPTVAATVMMPTLARLFVERRSQFSGLLRVTLRASLCVGMAVALGVAALAGPIIELLYAPEFAAATPVLRWLIVAAVWVMADQVLSSTMIAAQAQRQDLQTVALALVVLSLGLWWAVPQWGPVGAAAAVTVAQVVRVLWRVRWASRLLEQPALWTDLGRVVAASAAGLGALVAGLERGPWVALAGAWLAFALAARLLGLIGAHPVDDLRQGRARLRGGRTA